MEALFSDDCGACPENLPRRELGIVGNMLRRRGCTSALDGGDPGPVTHGSVLCAPSGRFVVVAVSERLADMRPLVALARDESVEYVLVVLARYNAASASIRAKEAVAGRKLEVWTLLDLLVDVSEHSLQPSEVYEYLGDMGGVPARALPEMLSSDPLARYYRLSPGSVVVLVSPVDGKPELMHIRR